MSKSASNRPDPCPGEVFRGVIAAHNAANNPRRCTGIRTNGKPCTTLLPLRKVAEDPWPGVTDRCQYHEDGIELRSRQIADVALGCGTPDWDLFDDTDCRISEPERHPAKAWSTARSTV